jgi:dynein heavy chain, axonemal
VTHSALGSLASRGSTYLQDLGGFFDRDKLFWKPVEDFAVVGACCPPGGGRQPMSSRITRHFAPLYIPEPSEATIRQIGDSIIGGFLSSKFAPEAAFGLIKPIVMSTIEVLNTAVASLLPTPSKMHYVFSLRDVRRVFQVCKSQV